MAQRVTETPKNPKLLNPAISQALATIILRCLERDPQSRYKDARALLRGVAAFGGAATAGCAIAACGSGCIRRQRPRCLRLPAPHRLVCPSVTTAWRSPRSGKYIAVLPFRAVGADPNLKYEAQGVAESISARLFSLSSVHPVSSFALEQVDLAQPVKAIARKVGANLVVEGQLQSAGDSITIIASLDNVETGKRSWSRSFSGMRADLLTLEEEISNGVIAALNVTPTLAERERTTVQPTQDLTAYDEYLKGRDTFKSRRDADGAQARLALFEQASTKDPSFALAWTGVADASLEIYKLKHDSFWSEKAHCSRQGSAEQERQSARSAPRVGEHLHGNGQERASGERDSARPRTRAEFGRWLRAAGTGIPGDGPNATPR